MPTETTTEIIYSLIQVSFEAAPAAPPPVQAPVRPLVIPPLAPETERVGPPQPPRPVYVPTPGKNEATIPLSVLRSMMEGRGADGCSMGRAAHFTPSLSHTCGVQKLSWLGRFWHGLTAPTVEG